MMKRWSVAFLVLAVSAAAYAPEADAGKGKLRRGGATLGRNRDGVVFNEKFTHTKGIRSKLTGGALGKTMGLENTVTSDGVRSTLGRGRIRPAERVTHTTTGIPGGTRSEATHHKRGTLMRWKNRLTTSRTDDVVQGRSTDTAVSETRKHRFTLNPFSNKPGKVKEVDTSRMDIDVETGEDALGGMVEKLDGDGNVTTRRETGGRRWGKAFRSKLEGQREVVNTPQGPEIIETFQAKWGFWRMVKKTVTLGLAEGGGKTVEVEHRQTAFGTEVRMTTPREQVTRSTQIQDGRTVSNGTYARNGFWGRTREKDSVVIDDQKGVYTVEELRSEDGSTKKATTRTEFVNGSSIKETETAGKYKVAASSPRTDRPKGRNWTRGREGRFLSWQYGRANGNFRARFDTPWFNMGNTVFQVDKATGEVTNVSADEAAADEGFDDGEAAYAAQ